MHQHTKILLKYVQTILEISCFYTFQMAIGHHVEFLKALNLYADALGRFEAHNHAKFSRN